jgi:hypothetical protein
MPGGHLAVGIFLLLVTISFLATRYFRVPKRHGFRWWGWAGLAIITVAECLLYFRVPWLTTFFTPVAWTGYLLLADALVASLNGASLLGRSPRDFLWLCFWSVPLWLIFEAYNLRLENWVYRGLPQNPLLLGFGYVWSFATIWPALFETAELLQALGLFSRPGRRVVFSGSSRGLMFLIGLVAVSVPVLVPERLGSYLFGLVWIGFVLLLDPLSYRWKGWSFLGELEQGKTLALRSFLAAGWVCGILWEFWNYWAAARWVYVFPIGQSWRIFAMPALGYLGFLPFALETKVMYELLRTVRGKLSVRHRQPRWEAARSER